MAEKYKVLRNAEKFVIEKKFSQAIQEYEKLLQQDGEDPTLLNTIGDLHVRVKNTSRALQYFRKVAEIYLATGFTLRAIATFKKIHALDSSDVSVNENLAELFQKQGLRQDAKRHLEVLIDHHRRAGAQDQVISWLRRAVEVDPSNARDRTRLAELLALQGDADQAADQYQEAVRLHHGAGRWEDAVAAAKTAFEVSSPGQEILTCYVDSARNLDRLDESESFLRERLDNGAPELPYRLCLALVLERKGEGQEANAIYRQLGDQGAVDLAVTEGLHRTSPAQSEAPQEGQEDFLIETPAPPEAPAEEPAWDDAAEPAGDELSFAAPTQAEESDSEASSFELEVSRDFDLGSEEPESGLDVSGLETQEAEDWGPIEDQGQPLGESPFHPAGVVEEVELPEQASQEPEAPVGSGLFLDDDEDEQPQAAELSSGLFDDDDLTQDSFGFDDSPSDTSFEEPADDEPSLEAEDDSERGMLEEDDEGIDISSVEEALEEVDFYLKLGFQEEAVRVLKVLAREYPEDERVVRRTTKVPGFVPPKPVKPADKPAAVPSALPASSGGFEEEIDTALDALFEAGDEEAPGEVLRYDIEKTTEERADNPKVHYDLGLAYKEMGMEEDAIQEFLGAIKLLKGEQHNPVRILCCSTLANSYLQLRNYDDAIHWARQGLSISDIKDFEWKALQYELGCALQEKGEFDPALESFNRIAQRDKAYRDVTQRIAHLGTS